MRDPHGPVTDAPRPSALTRLGTACAHRPWRVIAVWVAVLVLSGVGSKMVHSDYSDSVDLHTQGYAGLAVLRADDPAASGYTGRVVIHAADADLASERKAVTAAVQALAKLPHVLSASDPLAAHGSTLSADHHTAYSLVQFDVLPKSLGGSYVPRLDAAVAPMRAAGLQVYFGGDLDLLTQPPLGDGRSEAIGLAVAILVLLVGFGSVLGAAVPMLTALVSVGIGAALLGIVASVLTFATAAPTLAVMIGLGVALDYALFVTARFRQLVARGGDPLPAIGATVATSGHAVAVAAVTVSIAILGLYASGLTFVGRLGLAAVLSVVTAGAAGVTLVPAGLALAGRRIDALTVRRAVGEADSDSGGWYRYAAMVARRPWTFLAVGVAVLAVLAVPTLSMRLGHVDDGADPTSFSDEHAYALMSSAYGPGVNGPFTVVVDRSPDPTARPPLATLRPAAAITGADGGGAGGATELAAVVHAALASTPDVASVSPVVPTPRGRALIATVVPRTGPQDGATTALFHRLTRTVLPDALRGRGADGYVTGSAAIEIELVDAVTRGLPITIGVVVAAAFLLLLITFRGLLLAVKAAVLNLLSIAAAYGFIVAVFQWGWGRSLLGVSENVPIESYVPVMMFAIVFGLSLDYEVFLLSRVKEVWETTGDNELAVSRGLASTARVISCAALIMASVFAAFALSGSVVIKMIALGLAFSILVDATIVRLLLVPAVMHLLGGESSWWMPRWLDRLLPSFGGDPAVDPPQQDRMRIALATLGSRGDVQPLVVLASELHRRGHSIVMGVPPNLMAFVRQAGFEAHPLGPDSREFLESPDGQRWLASGNARKFLEAMSEVGHEMAPIADAQLLRVSEGADLLVCGLLGEDHALCVAEAKGIPLVTVHTAPIRPSGGYPHYIVTTKRLPRLVNRATWAIVERVLWRELEADTNLLRRQLGLRKVSSPTPVRMAKAGVLELQVYSRVLVPDLGYGRRRPLTGSLTPDGPLRDSLGEGAVDPGLDAWLASGPPPAFFGFGSMPVLDPAACLAMIRTACSRVGLRALVSAGWSGLAAGTAGAAGDDVRIVGAIDHDRILPRCRLAVHHGGAGTTAAAAAAGIPSLVCSVFADQPFWGARIEELGAGVHIPFPSLDGTSLEVALRHLLKPAVAQRASTLGESLRADAGGARRAADLIEQWTSGHRRPRRDPDPAPLTKRGHDMHVHPDHVEEMQPVGADARRRRRTVAVTTGALALLVGVVTTTGEAAASPARPAVHPVLGPAGSAFYTPPDPLPKGPHGSLIWYSPESVTSSGISGATAYAVLYTSTSASQSLSPTTPGTPDAVGGTVIIPTAPWTGPGKRPIITYDVGTQGMGANCAASKEIAAGTEYDIAGIQAAVSAGYAVVVTDYEGYVNGGTHTYTVGQSAGHATLDIVRAATELPGAAAAGITTANPVGIWGYSEGGQAAAWAAQEYATYTPHMDVIGVAAGGVPADLKVTATSLNGGLGSAFLFDAVIGFHTAYPSLPYASLINSAGESAFATITSADECVFQELSGYAFQNISTYTNGSETLAQLLAIPQWSAALDANQLGNTPFAAPLFTYHAFLDEIVPTSTEEQLATDYCNLGMSVDETTYYLADHLTADIEAVPDVIDFFQARVAGTAPVSTC